MKTRVTFQTSVAILVLIVAHPVLSKTIGLDAVRGVLPEYNLGLGTDFTDMQEELEGAGYRVVPLYDFTPASLDQCDAVFLLQPTNGSQRYTEQEIADIHAYVAAGGGLLAISDGGYSSDSTVDNFEALLAPYGVNFKNAPTKGEGHVVTDFVPHPVTQGLSSVGLNYQRPLVQIETPAMDLTIGSGDDDCLAAVAGQAGAGNVVILSDSGPFGFPGDDTNLYAEDNLLLLLNIAQHVTSESPLTIGLDAVRGALRSIDSGYNLALGTEFTDMQEELEGAGYRVVPLHDLTPASLNQCDAVFLLHPTNESQTYTEQEIADIHAYVAAGGGLLAISDGGWSSDSTVENFEALLAPYGVGLDDAPTKGEGHVVTDFVPHPVTQGLSSVGLNYQRPLVRIDTPATDLTVGDGDDDFLAVVEAEAGAGNVVIISDSAPFGFPGDDTNLYAEDNLLLLLNIAEYVTSKNPLAIGLDAVHGVMPRDNLALGTEFTNMQEELEGAGYRVVPLDEFTPASLDRCDGVFLFQPMRASQRYTEQEIADIHAYVAGGGGLLAISDGGYSSDSTVENFEALLAPYGVGLDDAPTKGSGHVVTDFISHPVTEGLSSVGLNYQRPLVEIDTPATDLTVGSGDDDFLAAVEAEAGTGNVVVISDSAPFGFPGDDTDLYAEDNLLLLLNVAQYVTTGGN